MKIDKNYLKYLLFSKKIAWLFCFVMYMVISLSGYLSVGDNRLSIFSNSLIIAGTLSIIMTFVLPVVLFSFVHRKRSCDQYFSLPIKRKNMLFTTFVCMFLMIMGYYLTTTILSAFLAIGTLHSVEIGSYIVSLAYLAGGCIALLLINSAIYLFANNIFDGIVLLLAYLAIIGLVAITCNTIFDTLLISFFSDFISNGLLFSPVGIVFTNFYHVVSLLQEETPFTASVLSVWHNVFLLLYAIAACFLLKKHFIQRKTERAEQPSNTFLAYPFIINFYLIFWLFIIAFSTNYASIGEFIIFYLMLFFVYIIAIFIYKRKLKLYWKNALYYIIVAIATSQLSHFIYANKAFGLPYLYPTTSGETINYSYSAYATDPQYNSTDDSYYNVSISFQLSIPVAERNDAKYKQAFNELESFRKQSIDTWFEKGRDLMDYTSSLMIQNTKDTPSTFQDTSSTVNAMSYTSDASLSIDTLRKIDKLTTVQIYVSNETNDAQYTLEQYIKEFNK